jgi:hypothetical protein
MCWVFILWTESCASFKLMVIRTEKRLSMASKKCSVCGMSVLQWRKGRENHSLVQVFPQKNSVILKWDFMKDGGSYVFAKGKIVPVLNQSGTTPWRIWGSGCIDPHFLGFGTSWKCVVSFMPLPFYPLGKSSPVPIGWEAWWVPGLFRGIHCSHLQCWRISQAGGKQGIFFYLRSLYNVITMISTKVLSSHETHEKFRWEVQTNFLWKGKSVL